MNKMKKIVIATVAAVGIGAGATAMADRGGERGERGARMLERVSETLELDEGQRAALEALQSEMTEMRELMRGEQDMRETLKSMLSAESFDQNAALAMINQRTEAVQSQAPDLVAAAAVFLDGLSAEQKEQIGEFADRGKRFGRH